MNEHIIILIIAILVLVYGYISNWLPKFNISGPMIFTTFGLLLSPLGFHLVDVEINAEFVTILVEIALILVLFSDAALLDLPLLKRFWQLPTRLLFLGLPLTIFAGTLVAQRLFPDQPLIHLLMLALLLTPTDAALGKAVVTDKKLPKEIRATINVESGLNDGIIFPILITVVAVIVSGSEHTNSNHWLMYVFEQIVFGALVGGVIGYLAIKWFALSIKHDWIVESYQNLIPLALAILAYYLAESVSGNGFIAAFFAGLYAGNTNEQARGHIEDFAESEGELLVLISFFIFGLVFVPTTLPYLSWKIIIYALLSLTLLRVLPVMLALTASPLHLSGRLFIAWFGPRGVASILYVLIVAQELAGLVGFEFVYSVVTVTVILSIIAHGLTAQPFTNWYAKLANKAEINGKD